MGAVHHLGHFDRGRDRGEQAGEACFDLVNRVDDVGVGLLENDQLHAELAVLMAGDQQIIRGIDRLADVTDPDRCAVAERDHQVVVLGRLGHLVVGVDGEAAQLAIDAALGGVDRRLQQGEPRVFHGEPHGGQPRRVDLHPHGALTLPADKHLADPGDGGDLLGKNVVGVIVNRDQVHFVGLHRQNQDRAVGRVDLIKGRRIGQVARQLAGGGGELGLNVERRAVDAAVEVELHGHAGAAEHGIGGHLRDAGDLREHPFERLGHRGCHGFRAGARERHLHRNRREFHVGQRCHRQQRVGDDTNQHNRGNQQRSSNRAADERGADAHACAAWRVGMGRDFS